MSYFKITECNKKTSELIAECKNLFPVSCYWNDEGHSKKVLINKYMVQLKQDTNTGVITVYNPKDWMAGGISGIVYKEVNLTGDWTNYLPEGESQSAVYFDSYDCVTRAATNCLETQLNFMIANNLLSKTHLDFLTKNGYILNGNVNFSDRFTAKMSGTTPQGNYFAKVWDSIRKDGLLPESDWTYNRLQTNPVFNWDDYYAEIPQELKDKAKKFLDYFEMAYEIVDVAIESIKVHLKQAPVQIATKVCSPWNTTELIKACGIGTQHATEVYAIKEDIDDFDSYSPYQKNLALDYGIGYALKGIISPKVIIPAVVIDPLVYRYGETRTWGSYLKEIVAGWQLRSGIEKYKLFIDGKWHMTYIVAIVYGGYTVEECLKNIKYGHIVHPTIKADAWRKTKDYLQYIIKVL